MSTKILKTRFIQFTHAMKNIAFVQSNAIFDEMPHYSLVFT